MTFPELLMFDCDGVLIDSEGLALSALVETLAEFGIEMSMANAMENYMGRGEFSEIPDVLAKFQIALPPEYFVKKNMRRTELFEAHLKAIPGAASLIDAFPNKKCVASGSTPERLQFSLSLVGLWERFAPHIYSSRLVAHGKPAPDLFLYVADQMNVALRDCLIIEDSVAGVKAAKAAGIRVYGFIGGQHCLPGHGEKLLAEGAEAVFKTMSEIARALDLQTT